MEDELETSPRRESKNIAGRSPTDQATEGVNREYRTYTARL